MRRIADGDEGAFRLLVSRWEQPVFAFLARMVGSEAEAEDLVQDTFLKVFDQAPRYRPQGKFKSWLFRIAGNKARGVLRRRRIVRWLSFDPAVHDRPGRAPDPQRRLEDDEEARRVREAVDRLPDRQRQALILQRFQGFSYQEVAAALDTSAAAVESLLQRAARELRRELAELAPPGRGRERT